MLPPARAEIADLHPPQHFQLWPAAKPMGDIRFQDVKHKTLSLADFKGRLVLLHLWATWCPPCGLELPSLEHLQKLLGPEGLTVVPVSIDAKGMALVAPFYRENNITDLPMYFDQEFALAKALNLPGVPVTLVVSRDGWEVGRYGGPYEWTKPEMVTFLRKLLHDN